MKVANTIYRSVSLLLLTVILAGGAFAQAREFDVADQVKQVSEFDVNGLKVLLKRRENAPTLSASLIIRGGVRNVTDKNAGIEKLSLSVATEGSKKYPRDVLRRELASTGTSIAASSGLDYSAISMASTLDQFDKSWDIYSDLILNPTFDAQDVARVREQIIAGLKEEQTDTDTYLELLQRRDIYAGLPYSRAVNGTVVTVSEFKISEIREYFSKLMESSRLLLVVVGDIDAANLRAKISSSLGKLPKGNYTEQPLTPAKFEKPSIEVVAREGLPTNYISGGFLAPSLSDPDYYPMQVAISVLATRLFSEVRVRRQLTYAVSADMEENASNSGNLYVTAVDANEAVGVMLAIVNNLKTEPLDQDEIDGMAGHFLTRYYLERETNAAQAAELAKFELSGGGWKNSFLLLDRLRRVKPQDVQRVARTYLKNFKWVVIGDPNAVDKAVFTQQ
ncbi:MAG: M16 family metallopeptidase [Pyrinomonadaceae bacterium]